MRQHSPPVGSQGLPASATLSQVLTVALALAALAVGGALALLYPGVAVTLAAVAGVTWVGTVLVQRVTLTRRSTGRLLLVRVPFTDVRFEV